MKNQLMILRATMTSKVIFLAILALSGSVEIPSNLKKCNQKDPNFKQCLQDAILDTLTKSPIKEIGFPVWDPLAIPALTIGAGTGAVGFSQNFKNMSVTGLSTLSCPNIDYNPGAKTFTFECSAKSILLEFQYEINGKILLLPIYGKGPGSIKLIEPSVHVVYNLEEYEKKGKKHLKITDQKVDLNPKSIVFRLDNLFDGDKALGDNINQVLNDNWAEVFGDVQRSYEETFGKIFASVANGVFAKVSIPELFGES